MTDPKGHALAEALSKMCHEFPEHVIANEILLDGPAPISWTPPNKAQRHAQVIQAWLEPGTPVPAIAIVSVPDKPLGNSEELGLLLPELLTEEGLREYVKGHIQRNILQEQSGGE